MAVKRVVEELCPRCGEIQARLLPDGSVSYSHQCPKGPPGPPDVPRRYRPGDVCFVPADPKPLTPAQDKGRAGNMVKKKGRVFHLGPPPSGGRRRDILLRPDCRHCGKPFGEHDKRCPVKFRDTTNPDPNVQRQHEALDDYYASESTCPQCEGSGSEHVVPGVPLSRFDPKCPLCGGTGIKAERKDG